jgi:site-specific recombinase XerD
MKTKPLSHYVQTYFLSYLIAQRGYGKNTVASYRDTFKLLFTFLEENKLSVSKLSIENVDKTCIMGFLHWLESRRKNAISTRNVRLAHLKSFWGYVLATTPEWADHCSQIIQIPFKKAEKKPPAYLTETETKQLLCMPDGNTRSGIRHMAMLSLLYDSGCRVQELISLNTSDISLGNICKLFIKGKGDKYREIPIMQETGKILEKYIRIYERQPEKPLFCNSRGECLTRAGISHILNKYQKLAKEMNDEPFQERLSPHLLRHSKATHLVNNGVSIYNIRDFLGHASVTTTQVYLTSNPEVMREAIERASLRTAPDSAEYFSTEEKADLMAFLETLI